MNKKYMDFVPASAIKQPKKQPAKKPEVAKRPGAKPAATGAKPTAASAKPTAMSAKSLNELDRKKAALKLPPRPNFVNTEKVAKRPLSKNVYPKKVVAPKEEPAAPVTIISKPEKDSKVGLVVAIIITIILGAAAGTVAFLLLPK